MPPTEDTNPAPETPTIPVARVSKVVPAEHDPSTASVSEKVSENVSEDVIILDDEQTPPKRKKKKKWPRIAGYVRILLALMAIAFLAVLIAALWIRPYDDEGNPKTMATHTQLGMPPCNMVVMTGRPCPACGMTTSFSLLAHGDVLSSMKANWVGTMLATFVWLLIPWGFACAYKGRLLWIRNPELTLTILLSILLVLMVVRWGWIMATFEPKPNNETPPQAPGEVGCGNTGDGGFQDGPGKIFQVAQVDSPGSNSRPCGQRLRMQQPHVLALLPQSRG